MRTGKAIAGLGALAAAATLGGCLGENPNTPTGRPAATINVRESEMKIEPANPTIKKPGVVEFKIQNAGHVVHALEIKGPKGEVRTQEIPAGKSTTLTANLDKPGMYRWYCPVPGHEAAGMKGTITVASAG
jgi:nitrite reductase (NO-forming)